MTYQAGPPNLPHGAQLCLTSCIQWCPAVCSLFHPAVPRCAQPFTSSRPAVLGPFHPAVPDVHNYAWPFPSSGAKLCSASFIQLCSAFYMQQCPAVHSFSHPAMPRRAWPLPSSCSQLCPASFSLGAAGLWACFSWLSSLPEEAFGLELSLLLLPYEIN